ncbi:hypothetical protein RZS28_12980 [Methylocapsa polymorpha]|uniref:Uncharacterized protein n=1 Tax=Methylocapsa polymorpha TaxID=3080828 RepID=A0ABZ0HQ37_9HYPH|nr:hypothetical protein RZS28_12980 [Methylocapsa sp. RX1]
MANATDDDYEYVEVTVSKKIEIRFSVDNPLTAAQKQAGAVTSAVRNAPAQAADRVGQAARLAQQVKNFVSRFGQPKSPNDSP